MKPSTSAKTSSSQKVAGKDKMKSLGKILAQKTFILRTGTYDNVIKKHGKAYLCGICGCELGFIDVRQHIAGKRHNALLRESQMAEMRMNKGGHLPPGVEEKSPPIRVQDALDECKTRPLIGLEYILEIVHGSKFKPSIFLCTLCHKKGDTRMALTHTKGFIHKAAYLNKHFPTAFRHLEIKNVSDIREVHKPVLEEISRAIEATYGRLRPTQVDAQKFWDNEEQYFNILYEGQHFSESSGETFENLVIEELSKVPEKQPGNSRNIIELGKLEDHERVLYDDYSSKLERFNELAKDIDDEMERELIKYKENPDDHPLYNVEWNKFWKERYMDLKARGEDTSAYDFETEWKHFWSERILELHHEEIESKKLDLRRMLDLPDGPIPVPSYSVNDREVMLMDDEYYHSRNSSTKRTRSRSPMSKDRSDQNRRGRVSPLPHREPPSQHRELSRSHIEPPSHRESSRSDQRRTNRDSRSPCRESPSHRREFSRSHKESSPRSAQHPRFRFSPPPARDSPSHHREVSRSHKESPPHRESSPRHRESSPRHRESSPRRRESNSSRDPLPQHTEFPSRPRYSPLAREYKRRSASPGRDRNPEKMRKMSDEWSKSRVESKEMVLKKERVGHRDSYDKHRVGTSRFATDVEVDIVVLLKLLTALEERLGSLGPKVTDLLANALIMENKRANSSEELLYDETNCILLETVGEKLKGHLQAGLANGVQEELFRTAIRDIETAIHMARKKRREGTSKNLMKVPSVGVVDKEKISTQIVNTLMAQGRKDITQEELDQMMKVLTKKDSSEVTSNRTGMHKMDQDDRKGRSSSMNFEDEYSSFKDDPRAVSHKVKENKMLDQSLNRNIISGVPPKSITTNEFSMGGRFGDMEDFYRQNPAKQQETMMADEDLRFKHRSSLLPLPDSSKPYVESYANSNNVFRNSLDVSNTGRINIPEYGPDRDARLPAASSLLGKPFGFPVKNSVSSSFQDRFPPSDANNTFSNVGGAIRGNANNSLLFSDGPLLRSFSKQTMPQGNNPGWRGGESDFRSKGIDNLRGEMTKPMGRIPDFRDGQGIHGIRPNINREGHINSEGIDNLRGEMTKPMGRIPDFRDGQGNRGIRPNINREGHMNSEGIDNLRGEMTKPMGRIPDFRDGQGNRGIRPNINREGHTNSEGIDNLRGEMTKPMGRIPDFRDGQGNRGIRPNINREGHMNSEGIDNLRGDMTKPMGRIPDFRDGQGNRGVRPNINREGHKNPEEDSNYRRGMRPSFGGVSTRWSDREK